jgi:hypothetical protein
MQENNPFFFENGFYHTAPTDRMGKLLAHLELYQKIKDLPGDIIECGVLRGNSLIRFLHFRDVLETPSSRKVWGFDMFGNFPRQDEPHEKAFLDKYVTDTNDTFVTKDELETILTNLGLRNYQLVGGDILETIPNFTSEYPQVRIALLHIDVDLMKPTATILSQLYDKVVPGGIVAFDDYGLWPGETEAVEHFFKGKGLLLKKSSYAKSPTYLIKPHL